MRHLALAAVYVLVAVLLLPGTPLAAEEDPAGSDPAQGSGQSGAPGAEQSAPGGDRSAPGAAESSPPSAEQPAPAPAQPAPDVSGQAPAAPPPGPAPEAAAGSDGERWQPAGRKAASRTVARKAASQTVSMRDFSFAPATVSVSVGDTVTWRNDGKIDHTATANDGSFDTGNVASGQSGSVTFEKAGSFAYICTIHPNMKGTVQVAAAGGGGSGGGSDSTGESDSSGSAGSGGGSSGSAGASDSGESLPNTGSDAARLAGVGLLLLALGAAARFVERRRAAS
jgi:plastocyanin